MVWPGWARRGTGMVWPVGVRLGSVWQGKAGSAQARRVGVWRAVWQTEARFGIGKAWVRLRTAGYRHGLVRYG
jgi:transposase